MPPDASLAQGLNRQDAKGAMNRVDIGVEQARSFKNLSALRVLAVNLAVGGKGKPRYAELTVCLAESEVEARRTAYDWWPIAGLRGSFLTELARPAYFEQAARLINGEDVAREVVCGPDPERHIAGIKKYLNAGFDHLWVHQVGPDQDGFFRFYEREILPELRSSREELGRSMSAQDESKRSRANGQRDPA